MFLHHSSSGLTLIEIVVVTIIVSILALLSIPVYQEYQQQARQQLVQAELLTLANRLEAGYSSQSGYQSITSYAFPASDSFYQISVTFTHSNTSYDLIAAPINAQTGSGALAVNSLGERRHYTADTATGSHDDW